MRGLGLRLAVIVSSVAAAVGGLSWGSSALAAPARPDLRVDLTVSAAEVPVVGGILQLAVVVRNLGSGAANDLALKLRPPAGATLGGEDPGALARPAAAGAADTPLWQCDVGGVWRCTQGAVAAGSQAEALRLALRLPPASAGQVVTVSATVSTSSLETATTNNTDKVKLTSTGVGDLAMELLVGDTEVSKLGGRSFVQARVTNVGTAPVADVGMTMEPPPGGRVQLENVTTYTQPLAPGRYFVRVEVSPTLDSTTPNVGDEATDSDVVFTARADDGVTAQSAVVEAVDGQHTVVDIGLVPTQP